MINFNEPIMIESAFDYVREAINNKKLSGDGEFTKRCCYWLGQWCKVKNVLLTTSCTHATEMAAMLAQIRPGDEVIMPAFTFVSTADAFVLRGAKVKFVDIRPDTMNIDENLIEPAVQKSADGERHDPPLRVRQKRLFRCTMRALAVRWM